MRAGGGRIRFAPRIPSGMTRLRFSLRYRESRIAVTVGATSATYELLDGPPLTVEHHGEPLDVSGEPVEAAIPPAPVLPRPTQPAGREPAPRRGRLAR
jgi:alpha,alpha-trehalose phosphorylase